MKLHRLIFPMLIAIAVSAPCIAASPQDVLAETPLVKLTRADYDAAIALIPQDLRDEFATSSRRLTMLLNNILLKKTLAVQAQQAGLAPDPEVLRVAPDDTEAALAAARVRAIEEAAGHEFDARRDTLVVTARENYRLTKEKYKTVAEVKISAIRISTAGRGAEAALALAKTTRERLTAGFDFAALARQISEDKDSAPAGGALPWATADQMSPALAKAAFALRSPGELSEPVLVGDSYILIRLDDRRPSQQLSFDEVKDSIFDSMRAEHIRKDREEKVDAIRNDPNLKVNRAAVDALIVRIDPERMRPPAKPLPGTLGAPK